MLKKPLHSQKVHAPYLITCHGRPVSRLAESLGWLPGARYTNLRDVRGANRVGLIDIEWDAYDFSKHLAAVKATRPLLTVAMDLKRESDLSRIIDEADELHRFATNVILVPKDPRLAYNLVERIPKRFILGYSVPTRYGRTALPLASFAGRPVHLLGGRPDTQLRLARRLEVFSVDINGFTLDASFGDYFDGELFRPHPEGGYMRCIEDSIRNITRCWAIHLREKYG